ncbi:unnamed protein product [Spodoptera littoralis]|uniref:BED-type domain-containing protein n=1 Tax=Spodoptera littoralis TaxID=7109 RepID=A0A9P0MY36_SPOLI|nr:unnamed protein product [Spodoptera littoralis]CAH1634668.1 unnamed protein product [Spodoptera littoralis]
MSLSKESVYVKHKKDEDVTSVWSHFLVDKMGSSAKCKRCSAILKTLGGSTKGLHTHLFSKHSIKIDSAKASSSTSQNNEGPPSKRKMTDYFVKPESDTLDDVLARMTALDGFPFSVFVTSKDLRSLLLTKGYSDLPKSASTIRNRVLDYSVKIKKQITAELSTLKKEGQRLSLSFDEWTSTSIRQNLDLD